MISDGIMMMVMMIHKSTYCTSIVDDCGLYMYQINYRSVPRGIEEEDSNYNVLFIVTMNVKKIVPVQMDKSMYVLFSSSMYRTQNCTWYDLV